MTRPLFTDPANRIMVALDVDELVEAEAIIDQLADTGVIFKVGNQLGTFEGWKTVIDRIHQAGASIFCDTKFKDIPETVKKSSWAISRLHPEFFNVMADTQVSALEAAIEGIGSTRSKSPIILGVTVLTSMTDEESMRVYGQMSGVKVLEFAANTAKAGLDGVVCSAKEAALLRSDERTKDLILVTPGIRPEWAASGDQARIVTPRNAIEAGADYLVIGRPITQPPAEIGSPRDAVLKIIEELM